MAHLFFALEEVHRRLLNRPTCWKLPPKYFVVDDQHRGIHRLRIARLLDIFNQRIRNLVPSGTDDVEDEVWVERLHRG